MAFVAVSSFWIHQIRLVGPWSPIHLLSIFTLLMLSLAVWRAHTHRVARPPPHHDLALLARPGHCRAVYAGAGADPPLAFAAANPALSGRFHDGISAPGRRTPMTT
jgi:hypothetical protein